MAKKGNKKKAKVNKPSKQMVQATEMLDALGKPYVVILLESDSMLKADSENTRIEFESNLIIDMQVSLMQKVAYHIQNPGKMVN